MLLRPPTARGFGRGKHGVTSPQEDMNELLRFFASPTSQRYKAARNVPCRKYHAIGQLATARSYMHVHCRTQMTPKRHSWKKQYLEFLSAFLDVMNPYHIPLTPQARRIQAHHTIVSHFPKLFSCPFGINHVSSVTRGHLDS